MTLKVIICPQGRSEMPRHMLMKAFAERQSVPIQDSAGDWHMGIIARIEHEDGSGNSFNVHIDGGWIHVKTA